MFLFVTALVATNKPPSGHSGRKNLRADRLQGFQEKVPVCWQVAGHFKHRMAWTYLRVGSPQGLSSTKLKVPAGWQSAGHFKLAVHFKDQMA